MKNRYYKYLMIILLINVYPMGRLHAEGPVERYNINYDELSNKTLKGTIGILTLNSGVKKGTLILSYKESNGSFDLVDTLNVYSETIPVSRFGYERNEGIGNYRYPVIDKRDKYLRIVYNCRTDAATWIKIDDIEKDYYVTIIFLNNMVREKGGYYLDLFFDPDNKIKIYDSPERKSEYRILTKDSLPSNYYAIKAVEQKGRFIKIATDEIDYSTGGRYSTEIGWITVKDENNKIYFWIKMIDLD